MAEVLAHPTFPMADTLIESSAAVEIRACEEADQERWENFVLRHAGSTNYHRWRWQNVFRKAFGWPAIYLIAEQEGTVRGILPLIWQKSLLRSYLSSMPHLQGGGILADTPELERRLLAFAEGIARRNNSSYLELRHSTPHDLPLVLRPDKVGALLRVEADPEKRMQRLDKKTRNLVRKSLTFGMTADFGGPEMLSAFYDVYRSNMRDLGSPAYARDFFSEILSQFPEDTRICVVRFEDDTVAAAFLLGFRDTLEVAWASSHRRHLNLKPNMFLYWNILTFAADEGYPFIDFGRSSRGSGTYQFKLQWGAEPKELYWGYWLNQRTKIPTTRTDSMQLASRLWQRLPVAITNVLGPRLVRHIPGI